MSKSLVRLSVLSPPKNIEQDFLHFILQRLITLETERIF